MLRDFEGHTNTEVAVRLGVVNSYVSKLRKGWRPKRVREDLWARLQQFDPAGPAVSTQPAEFYDGVLFAAQAMSETVTRLLAEARAGLRPASLTPTAGEVVVGMQALDAAERELPGHPPRRRKGQSRPA